MQQCIFDEFLTVDLLLQSSAETRAVDAFVISWVKLEKQLRRLIQNLVFQHPDIDGKQKEHKEYLLKAILAKKTGNHDRFIGAIYRLSGVSVKEIIGDQYKPLKKKIDKSYKHRQKIFHGQQTGDSLERSDLEDCIEAIRFWCERLAIGSSKKFGYDGLSRNSLRKNIHSDISDKVSHALPNDWKEFIKMI